MAQVIKNIPNNLLVNKKNIRPELQGIPIKTVNSAILRDYTGQQQLEALKNEITSGGVIGSKPTKFSSVFENNKNIPSNTTSNLTNTNVLSKSNDLTSANINSKDINTLNLSSDFNNINNSIDNNIQPQQVVDLDVLKENFKKQQIVNANKGVLNTNEIARKGGIIGNILGFGTGVAKGYISGQEIVGSAGEQAIVKPLKSIGNITGLSKPFTEAYYNASKFLYETITGEKAPAKDIKQFEEDLTELDKNLVTENLNLYSIQKEAKKQGVKMSLKEMSDLAKKVTQEQMETEGFVQGAGKFYGGMKAFKDVGGALGEATNILGKTAQGVLGKSANTLSKLAPNSKMVVAIEKGVKILNENVIEKGTSAIGNLLSGGEVGKVGSNIGKDILKGAAGNILQEMALSGNVKTQREGGLSQRDLLLAGALGGGFNLLARGLQTGERHYLKLLGQSNKNPKDISPAVMNMVKVADKNRVTGKNANEIIENLGKQASYFSKVITETVSKLPKEIPIIKYGKDVVGKNIKNTEEYINEATSGMKKTVIREYKTSTGKKEITLEDIAKEEIKGGELEVEDKAILSSVKSYLNELLGYVDQAKGGKRILKLDEAKLENTPLLSIDNTLKQTLKNLDASEYYAYYGNLANSFNNGTIQGKFDALGNIIARKDKGLEGGLKKFFKSIDTNSRNVFRNINPKLAEVLEDISKVKSGVESLFVGGKTGNFKFGQSSTLAKLRSNKDAVRDNGIWGQFVDNLEATGEKASEVSVGGVIKAIKDTIADAGSQIKLGVLRPLSNKILGEQYIKSARGISIEVPKTETPFEESNILSNTLPNTTSNILPNAQVNTQQNISANVPANTPVDVPKQPILSNVQKILPEIQSKTKSNVSTKITPNLSLKMEEELARNQARQKIINEDLIKKQEQNKKSIEFEERNIKEFMDKNKMNYLDENQYNKAKEMYYTEKKNITEQAKIREQERINKAKQEEEARKKLPDFEKKIEQKAIEQERINKVTKEDSSRMKEEDFNNFLDKSDDYTKTIFDDVVSKDDQLANDIFSDDIVTKEKAFKKAVQEVERVKLAEENKIMREINKDTKASNYSYMKDYDNLSKDAKNIILNAFGISKKSNNIPDYESIKKYINQSKAGNKDEALKFVNSLEENIKGDDNISLEDVINDVTTKLENRGKTGVIKETKPLIESVNSNSNSINIVDKENAFTYLKKTTDDIINKLNSRIGFDDIGYNKATAETKGGTIRTFKKIESTIKRLVNKDKTLELYKKLLIKENSYYIGKKISVNGKEAIVIDIQFGRPKYKIGNEVYTLKDNDNVKNLSNIDTLIELEIRKLTKSSFFPKDFGDTLTNKLGYPQNKTEKQDIIKVTNNNIINNKIDNKFDLKEYIKRFNTEKDFLYNKHSVPITELKTDVSREEIIKRLGKIESRTPNEPVIVDIVNGKLKILDGSQRYYQKLDAGEKNIDIVFYPPNTGEKNNALEFFKENNVNSNSNSNNNVNTTPKQTLNPAKPLITKTKTNILKNKIPEPASLSKKNNKSIIKKNSDYKRLELLKEKAQRKDLSPDELQRVYDEIDTLMRKK